MSDVTILVRVKLRLPTVKDFDEAEIRAAEIIEGALQEKLAIREVQMVKTESIAH